MSGSTEADSNDGASATSFADFPIVRVECPITPEELAEALEVAVEPLTSEPEPGEAPPACSFGVEEDGGSPGLLVNVGQAISGSVERYRPLFTESFRSEMTQGEDWNIDDLPEAGPGAFWALLDNKVSYLAAVVFPVRENELIRLGLQAFGSRDLEALRTTLGRFTEAIRKADHG